MSQGAENDRGVDRVLTGHARALCGVRDGFPEVSDVGNFSLKFVGIPFLDAPGPFRLRVFCFGWVRLL